MRALPVGIEEHEILEALAAGWRLDEARLSYVPKGGGSYHWLAEIGGGRRFFVTVDDLETKPWLGEDRDAGWTGLRAAYETSLALQERGLSFVVAPLRSAAGEAAMRLSSRFSLAVFPFVDGTPGAWGQPLSGDREEVLRMLAELHMAAPMA